jgi:soluble lytic murein transglycosylase
LNSGGGIKTQAMRLRWAIAIVVLIIVDVLLLRFWSWLQHERQFDSLIKSAARRYGVEPALVKAVIWRESRFNPKARGSAGEFGLMQVRPPAAEEWAQAEKISSFAPRKLLDPQINTQAGAWYLSKLIKRYRHTDNPVAYALADYNAGRTHVLRWMHGAASTNSAAFLKSIDYPGTQRYIVAVIDRSHHYEKRL